MNELDILNFLGQWLSLYLFVAGVCVLLSLLFIRTGLRDLYVGLLGKLFHWTENHPSLSRGTRLVHDYYEKQSSTDNMQNLSKLTFETASLWSSAVAAIANDPFTESQKRGELPGWNLLTRTDSGYAWISPKFTIIWTLGFFLRWFVLLPVRCLILGVAFVFVLSTSAVLASFPKGNFLTKLDQLMTATFMQLLARSISLSVKFHDRQDMPRNGTICVANHTSPIDIVVLSIDRYYSLVGQRHAGFLGTLESALQKVSQHIWFDRFKSTDRNLTKRLLREHATAGRPPIMVFPEGVCVNNTTVLKFRKGAFELGVPIHPVCITYDRRYGEPFWFQDDWARYHLELMTSWAIKADVRYLPPMFQEPGEDATSFAMRVKKAIADAGGLRSLEWDGTLKYLPVAIHHKEAAQVDCSAKLRAGFLDFEF